LWFVNSGDNRIDDAGEFGASAALGLCMVRIMKLS